MKKIPLTQGQFALVDDGDFDRLSQWKWLAKRTHTGRFYAARKTSRKGGVKGFFVRMHQEVLSSVTLLDHKDGNGLNNQRGNLRPATQSQNRCNRGPQRNNTSGFKGVSKCARKSKPWFSKIEVEGRAIGLGRFTTPELAAHAYDAAALKYHGEFAKLNFPVNTP